MSVFTPAGNKFLERLSEQILLGDGAMGTLLYSRGVPLDANFEYLNLISPDLVRQAHQDYADAGSELLETNTFRANALVLGRIGLERRVADINRAGARLARKAAGPDRLVAGAVGPLARGESGEIPLSQRREVLREQMGALAEGGVDLFLLETFSRLDDLETGVALAAELGLPAVAQMAFLEGGRTLDGISAEEAALRLTAAGAAVIGANCGSGPRDLLAVLGRMATVTDLPLSAFANSGFPQYVDGRYIYLATPEYFADRGQEMARAGARLLGGCCGTTPEHIRALAQRLKGLVPSARTARISVGVAPRAQEIAESPERRWLDAAPGRPLISVELDPPRGLDCAKLLEGAKTLAEAGVDVISLAENPLARIRMGNIALAARIQQETGVEVIVHLTGRDRNLIGLHSDLMGAHLLGIRNILAVTGDPVSVGGEAGATSVFDLNSVGILGLLSCLNEGRTLPGNDLGGRTQFLCGAAFNPNLASMDGQLRRLEKKIAAGARFVQTQPVYSLAVLDQMLRRTASLGVPVLVGILPLVSERNAEFLHNEVPGISLPQEVRARMKGKSGADGVREGMAIAAELVAAAGAQAAGFYIMPPFGKVELALELMSVIRPEAI